MFMIDVNCRATRVKCVFEVGAETEWQQLGSSRVKEIPFRAQPGARPWQNNALALKNISVDQHAPLYAIAPL